MPKHSKLLFVGAVLAFGIVQQLGRPKNCTICRINNALHCELPEAYALPTQLVAYTSVITVHSDAELRTAIANLKNNNTLKIAPGDYRGGLSVRGIDGLTVEAADPQQPPTFTGSGNAWHFSACSNLLVRQLTFKGQTGNGINIDDGGLDRPATHVTLEKLHISDIGPKGNHDGIKLSGLDQFNVLECTLEGWVVKASIWLDVSMGSSNTVVFMARMVSQRQPVCKPKAARRM